jgi:hypothetical protein
VGKDGKTLLETLEVVAQIKGRPPAELVDIRATIPEFPDAFGYVWDWFISLHNTRQIGMAACPITELEIDAFCRNRGMRMSLFELEAIRTLDRLALTDYSKEK